ncbi:hypothetical protein GCM10023107_88540 [Actinoplanes octamycinicus]|nr:hypothetical protein Aoc01nite_78430 [Actinoplanes octamycinicus]
MLPIRRPFAEPTVPTLNPHLGAGSTPNLHLSGSFAQRGIEQCQGGVTHGLGGLVRTLAGDVLQPDAPGPSRKLG